MFHIVILQVTLFRLDQFHTWTYFTSNFISSEPNSHLDLFYYSTISTYHPKIVTSIFSIMARYTRYNCSC